ncbi:hypothetical protein ACNKXS_03615 [Christiangramia marina]|uniref:hypothetical protein n=1 Tax=Christiangramia marina TaxID=409436 RepID=UPI003AA9A7AB
MHTNGFKYIRHYYRMDSVSNCGIIYELDSVDHSEIFLPEKVGCTIAGNKEFSPRNLDFFGDAGPCNLQPTSKPGIYEGFLVDLIHGKPLPTSTILARFLENEHMLVLDLFQGFYTYNPFLFKAILDNHSFIITNKAGV